MKDAEGFTVYGAAIPVTVSVEGLGELTGLENGNIADVTSYAESTRSTFNGRLAAYVRSSGKPGIIRVRASVPGVASAAAELEAR